MADREKRKIISSHLNLDFAEIVDSVRSFEKDNIYDIRDLLVNNEADMFSASESLCEMMNFLPPGENRDELMRRIFKFSGCLSVVSMLQYHIATKVIKQEAAHEGARTAGEKSSDITREVALLKRSQNGARLSCAQLVPHVQERRKAEKLRPLKDGNAETTIRRHLKGFSY